MLQYITNYIIKYRFITIIDGLDVLNLLYKYYFNMHYLKIRSENEELTYDKTIFNIDGK